VSVEFVTPGDAQSVLCLDQQNAERLAIRELQHDGYQDALRSRLCPQE
jgi:hypothetical protein